MSDAITSNDNKHHCVMYSVCTYLSYYELYVFWYKQAYVQIISFRWIVIGYLNLNL